MLYFLEKKNVLPWLLKMTSNPSLHCLGSSCQASDDCPTSVSDSYCSANATCQCVPGYATLPSKEECQAIAVGGTCGQYLDCCAINGGFGCTEGSCVCSDGKSEGQGMPMTNAKFLHCSVEETIECTLVLVWFKMLKRVWWYSNELEYHHSNSVQWNMDLETHWAILVSQFGICKLFAPNSLSGDSILLQNFNLLGELKVSQSNWMMIIYSW